MAGFEVVVRPVVFPNIRPAPARSLPPEDDPTKGMAVIRGNGASLMNNSYSSSMNVSRSRKTETKRRVDRVRIHQEENGGGGSAAAASLGARVGARAASGDSNGENYIDVDVANKIWSRGAGDQKDTDFYAPAKEGGNIELLQKNIIKNNG